LPPPKARLGGAQGDQILPTAATELDLGVTERFRGQTSAFDKRVEKPDLDLTCNAVSYQKTEKMLARARQ